MLNPSEKQSIEIAKQMKAMQDNMPAMIDMAKMQAQLLRVRYLALVAEGFTTDEALILCRSS